MVEMIFRSTFRLFELFEENSVNSSVMPLHYLTLSTTKFTKLLTTERLLEVRSRSFFSCQNESTIDCGLMALSAQ